jgi:hypothetical protein
MRKGIKNYRSRQSPFNSITLIEELVVKRMNATQFFKEYKEGTIVAVVFVIPTKHGYRSFKLPARVDQVIRVLYGEKKQYSPYEWDQARITAWANVRDWVDAQVALIETEQVKVEEVFLPYMANERGETLFEVMEKSGMKIPQLGSGAEEGKVVE